MTRLLWTASRSLNKKQLVRLEQAGYQVDWLPGIQLEPLSQVNPLKLQQGDAFFFVSRMAGQAAFKHLPPSDTLSQHNFFSSSQQTGRYLSQNYSVDCQALTQGGTSQEAFKHFQKIKDHYQPRIERFIVPISPQSQGKYQALGQTYLSDISIQEWIVYQKQVNWKVGQSLQAAISQANQAAPLAITIASASAWQALVDLVSLPVIEQKRSAIQLWTIGPLASQAILKSSSQVKPYHEANQSNFAGLVDSLIEYKI
ncbi:MULTISPECIES: uroporphyrinogen-III synthase [Aerococcus]|uniref:uroporphyrinogen-III synthase n=1 Tax=Aerococcus TaxID=1375 RepID=UPI0018A72ABB|nr:MULTISPECIES: uroporphyrinogen-III synthase [Aerococcus]MCY3038843.1 uroporphyrinogen-III synthase [Aerococcus sp. Group 2]MCY3040998.1 uroporphyrinogen-III synthase [Aerococcus sp. Group 2]MCY3042236.1 uroporphyrinogen-III synthase [Aerococcus sp. Group 2]MDK6520443.1 uroporphyrinogen-III synthase [Aerococcus urinae]